jgi:hypothetical protein
MKFAQSRTYRIWTVAAVLALFGVACGGSDRPKGTEMPTEVPSLHIEPKKGVFLRAGFDADPSDYIGRFINDDVATNDIDETKGVETTCSQYIEYKEVRAGGTYDEVYQASTSAGASLGVAPVAQAAGTSGNASAGMEDSAVVRVQYQLTKKMRGTKTPEYQSCCRENINGCSGRYLAEFWSGTGEIYQFVGSQQQMQADASAPATADGSVEYKNGAAWKRAMSFDDLYFAFITADAAISDDDCSWVDKLPISSEGQYFVGVSPTTATESKARSLAMREARKQAVQYLGEFIKTTSKTKSNAMKGYLEDEELVSSVAEGLAKRVKDDRYCPTETIDSPEGPVYKSRVLAFFPEEDQAEAAKEAVDKVEKKLEERGELSEENRKELENIKLELNERPNAKVE